jgi:RNA 2',3'-cyclic 3'-phosphodiesterase
VIETGSKSRRLFFALWPDALVRAQLVEVSRHWTRRPLADDMLHMTLRFLGGCSEQERICYSKVASSIFCEPFDLYLDYLGGWPRAGIQWLGTSQMPEALAGLVASLTTVLAQCGFEAEKRPFVPHVTLARKVRQPKVKAGLEAIRWPVRDFVLVESAVVAGGSRYEVLQRWPLQKTSRRNPQSNGNSRLLEDSVRERK